MTFFGISVYALVTLSAGELRYGALERKTHARHRGFRSPPVRDIAGTKCAGAYAGPRYE